MKMSHLGGRRGEEGGILRDTSPSAYVPSLNRGGRGQFLNLQCKMEIRPPLPSRGGPSRSRACHLPPPPTATSTLAVQGRVWRSFPFRPPPTPRVRAHFRWSRWRWGAGVPGEPQVVTGGPEMLGCEGPSLSVPWLPVSAPYRIPAPTLSEPYRLWGWGWDRPKRPRRTCVGPASTEALGNKSGGGSFLQKLGEPGQRRLPQNQTNPPSRALGKAEDRARTLDQESVSRCHTHPRSHDRRAAGHSAGPPRNSTPCVTRMPSPRPAAPRLAATRRARAPSGDRGSS